MKKKPAAKPEPPIIPIREIRGERILLDSDLAAIYGVATKRLNEQFRRNRERFPEDFAFQLTADEAADLRSQDAPSREGNQSQIAAGSPGSRGMRSQIVTGSAEAEGNRSQIATGSQRHRDPRSLPYAFTEHGALQAANILKSERAAAMSVFVIRAFVQMRAELSRTSDLANKLAELDARLTGRLDSHEQAIVQVMQRLVKLLAPPSVPPPPPKPKIGFKP